MTQAEEFDKLMNKAMDAHGSWVNCRDLVDEFLRNSSQEASRDDPPDLFKFKDGSWLISSRMMDLIREVWS